MYSDNQAVFIVPGGFRHVYLHYIYIGTTTTEQNKDNQATQYKKYDVNILFCTDAQKNIVCMSEISINIPIYKNTV